MALCPLCGRRRARRSCPAKGALICTVCCATKRLVEIPCPSDCVYLQSAERHPPAVVKRQQHDDLAWLMTTVGTLTEPQLHLLFAFETVILRFAPPGIARLIDEDVAQAAGALAAGFETASRGIIYEQQATSVTAEALRRELQELAAEPRSQGGSRFEREAAEVLRAIERGARHSGPGLEGGERAYLDLVGRLLNEGRTGSPPALGLDLPARPPSIIIP